MSNDAAVRVVVEESGPGSISLPDRLDMVDDGDDDERKTGTWQTDGFADADHQISIVIRDMGAGSVDID